MGKNFVSYTMPNESSFVYWICPNVVPHGILLKFLRKTFRTFIWPFAIIIVPAWRSWCLIAIWSMHHTTNDDVLKTFCLVTSSILFIRLVVKDTFGCRRNLCTNDIIHLLRCFKPIFWAKNNQKCPRGRPLFWNSITRRCAILRPKIPFLIISSSTIFNFILNTLAMISGRSCGN